MKNLIFTLFTLAVFFPAYASIDSIEVTEIDSTIGTFESQAAEMFSTLDMTEVTTGLFINKSYPLGYIQRFYGTIHDSSKATITDWKQCYVRLYGAYTDSTEQLPNPMPWFYAWDTLPDTNAIPITIMHYNYHRFVTGDTSVGLDYTNGKFYRSSGPTPFEEKSVFIATPVLESSDAFNLTFIVPDSLFKGNTGKEDSLVQIDFDDGQGYQTVSLDQDISVLYEVPGEKTIKTKITYKDESVWESDALFVVNESSSGRYEDVADKTWNIESADSYQDPIFNAPGKAELSLAYGCGNHKITRPLLIVEGFEHDPNDVGVDFEYVFEFLNEPVAPQGGGTNINLKEELEEAGYDLIFINLNDPSDYIQRNSYAVVEAIRQINDSLTENGTYENGIEVIGVSMGGVLSRYALRYIEQNKAWDHNCNNLITYDSPQMERIYRLDFKRCLSRFMM